MARKKSFFELPTFRDLPIRYPKDLTLYPFQEQTVKKSLKFLEERSTHSCYVASEMGLGKSITSLVTANTMGVARTLVICPAIMRLVWEAEIFKWCRFSVQSVPRVCTILTSSDVLSAHSASWVICSYSLASQKNVLAVLAKEPYDLLILDEAHNCVREDTLISTQRGEVPIKDLNITDKVWTILNDEVILTSIEQIITGDEDDQVELKLENGNVLNALGWHLVKANGKWIEARNLKVSDEVQTLRQDLGCSLSKLDQENLLFQRMQCQSSCSRTQFTYDKKQPNEEPRDSHKDALYTEENRTQTKSTGRKRQEYSCSSEKDDAHNELYVSNTSSCDRISDCNTEEKKHGVSDLLQGRHSSTGVKTSSRSGWSKSQGTKEERTGFKKADITRISRVESITFYKQGSIGSYKGQYYDLQLSAGHNYFASGINVHNCKNKSSKRTRAVIADLWPRCTYRILLSGTPMTRNVVDCWVPFHNILPEKFPTFHEFVERYSYSRMTKWAIDYYGLKNAEELSDIIRKHFYIRYKKEEVLTELPPKVWQKITLPASYSIKVSARQAKELYEQSKSILDDITRDRVAYVPPTMAEHRRLQGEAKVPAVVEFAQELLEQDIPVVIFAHHKAVVAALMESLKFHMPVCITGETNPTDRAAAVEAFQAGTTNLFIGNFVAAGVGITLTRSCTVILAELDWTPATINQAVDRLHRITQKNQVTVYYFIVRDSIDSTIEEIVISRTKDFNRLLDKGTELCQDGQTMNC